MRLPAKYPFKALFALLLCAIGVVGQRAVSCDVTDATECPIAEVCAPIGDDDGVCVEPPVSGAALSTDATLFPLPVAFFPLTGHSVASWPVETYNGEVRGAVWVQDHEFGSVLRCAENLRDAVVVENVPFGEDGAFTVNLWVKKPPTGSFAGGHHQFVFSTAAQTDPLLPTLPSQMHLFFPELGNPDHGVLRAVVRDGDDDGEMFHIDSDGLVNVTTPPPELGTPSEPVTPEEAVTRSGVELADGEWHMVTLTSVPAKRKRRQRSGFRLYVDGELVSDARGEDSTGGDPLGLTGEIYLCGRADDDFDRHFDGSVAKLSIFDEALDAAQIEALFVAVRQSTLAQQITTSEQLQIWNQKDNLTFYADPEIGLRYVRGPDIDPALRGRVDDVDVSSPPNTFSLSQFLSTAALCPTSPTALGVNLLDFCQEDEVCVSPHADLLILLHSASGRPSNETSGLDGICTTLPEGGSLWRGDDSGVPAPLAYFPLTGGDLRAWPIPDAQGRAVAAELVEDKTFGEVYECQQERGSFLILDNVAYGQYGPFAINLWFKPSDLSGDTFQYLFSHGSILPSQNPWINNQVQLYMSEAQSDTPRIVRATVKDTTDTDEAPAGATFLDSDGTVGFQLSTRRQAEPVIDVGDGEWHMLTVTTTADLARGSSRGFSMYLDGTLVSSMSDDVLYLGEDGIQRPVTGGDALRPGGKIYLCGRHFDGFDRHFSGRIAEVMLFDEPLRDAQIQTLYQAANLPRSSEGPGRKLLQTEIGSAESTVLSTEAERDTSIEGLPLGSWWGRFIGDPGEEFGFCSGEFVQANANRSEMVLCGEELSCLPVLTAADEPELVRAGICARYPTGGSYIFDAEDEIEVPIGYFPLSDSRLDSFPFPSYRGLASDELVFTQDEVFGSVMDCSSLSEDRVVLPNVPYPSPLGEFTVALWLRQKEHHLEREDDFETLFSHIGNPDTYSGLRDPNQIQILLVPSDADDKPVLRVVVRDGDDDKANLVFVETTGEIDVTDGLWHMVALTSHPEANHGFMVYLDGAVAGEIRGRNAVGSDPIRLLSDIHLCGTADGSNEMHYSGNLAHLMLWDAELSEQEILALYERLVVVAEGLQLDHPLRTTVEGEACLFPGVLNGQAVVDCAPLDGVLKCPVRNGSWVECMEFDDSDEDRAVEAIPAVVRTTVDGETCLEPGRIGDREVYGCVEFDGVFRCETRRGQWKECSPQVQLRYTTSGAPCVFPFTYQGVEFSDCAETELTNEICQIANGTFEACAPPVLEEGPEQIPPLQRMTAVVDAVLSRVTVDIEICQFPWWFDEKSVGSCVELNGTPQCRTINGTVAECVPVVYTIDREPCVFPFPHQAQLEFSCIPREGESMCRVADGSWGVCANDRVSIPVNEPLPLLLSRVTITNETCTFPFWFQGESVSDCVGESVQRCLTASDNFEECQPRRETSHGDFCSFPFDFEEETHYTCVEVEGVERCKTVNGTLADCAPLSTATSTVGRRITVSGESCMFPFEYNGQSQTDCVEIDGEEVCKVREDRWATCAPVVEFSIFSRMTTTGEACQIPFVFEEQLMTDCFTTENGTEYCRVEDEIGPLTECAPRPNNLPPERISVEFPIERNTTEGRVCVFPFQYQDVWWVNCVELDGTESCKIGDGSWQECAPEAAPTEAAAERVTLDGEQCIFPLAYNQEEFMDCVELDGIESCKIEDGSWQECAPTERSRRTRRRRSQQPSAFQRFTLDGDECSFPFAYNGEEHFDCVELDGTESCRDADGEWKECEPLENRASASLPRFALDGDACVFPLAYNGEEHYDCVVVDGTEQCKDERGRWEECVPLSPVAVLSEQPTNSESSPSSSSSDSLSAGAVVGIVIAVLVGILLIAALVGGAFYMRQKRNDKNFERSSKNFERFEGGVGDGIPMTAMGSSKAQKRRNGADPEATDEIPL